MVVEFDRRKVITGLGLAAGAVALPPAAARAQGAPVTWRASPTSATFGERAVPVWSLNPPGPLRGLRGQDLVLDLANGLPVDVVPVWRGLDGVAALAPLTALAPLAAGSQTRLMVPLQRSGTLLCDLRLLGDRQPRPLPAAVIVADDTETVADRDEVLLFEEWRLRGDNTALAPGAPAEGATSLFTVNGRSSVGIQIRANERLRLRLVSGCQRSIIAVKIEGHATTVIAIDGAPCEPFPARNDEIILVPGSRVDVVIDGRDNMAGASVAILLHDGVAPRPIAQLVYDSVQISRPFPPAIQALPSHGLPERLDLQRALRVELAFDGAAGEWSTPREFRENAPAFRVKRGRVVVASLTNRAAAPAVFHLHGHHARLLDRLDDGWKPFWLDTLVSGPGQTQRIAFFVDTAGSWLIEGMLTQWSAPRLTRWFTVEP